MPGTNIIGRKREEKLVGGVELGQGWDNEVDRCIRGDGGRTLEQGSKVIAWKSGRDTCWVRERRVTRGREEKGGGSRQTHDIVCSERKRHGKQTQAR